MGDNKKLSCPVTRAFKCKETGIHYAVGSNYSTSDDERITALQKSGFLLLGASEEVSKDPDVEYPRHVGGGTFELSNGEKVKGKEVAVDAQKLLDGQGDANAAGGQTGTPDKPE